MLKDIPTGTTFTIRLVEPMKSGFQDIGPRSGPKGGSGKKAGYGSGKETLRFKANGNTAIEDEVRMDEVSGDVRRTNRIYIYIFTFKQYDEATQVGIDAINMLLDSFMGINDAELATQVCVGFKSSLHRFYYNTISHNTIVLFRYGTLPTRKPTRWTLRRQLTRPIWRRSDLPMILSSNCGEPLLMPDAINNNNSNTNNSYNLSSPFHQGAINTTTLQHRLTCVLSS